MHNSAEHANHVSLFLHEDTLASFCQLIRGLTPGRALLLRMASQTRLVSLYTQDGEWTPDLVLECSFDLPLLILQTMVAEMPRRCIFRPANNIPLPMYQAAIEILQPGTSFRPAVGTPNEHLQIARGVLHEGCQFIPSIDMHPFLLPAFSRVRQMPDPARAPVLAAQAESRESEGLQTLSEDFSRLSLYRKPVKRSLTEDLEEEEQHPNDKRPKK